jgi:hypothetical protein
MASISKKLQCWAFEALDLGFACFSDGDHSPFVLLVDRTGERHLISIESMSGVIDAELVQSGRQIIQGFGSGQLYGVVWDGYLTRDGVKQDAVFVEAADQRTAVAFVFAQAYKRKKRSKRLEKVGQPLVAASAPHQWSRTCSIATEPQPNGRPRAYRRG